MHMLADILTKMMSPGAIFKKFRTKQLYLLTRGEEEQLEEHRRLGLRRGQRRRRKERNKEEVATQQMPGRCSGLADGVQHSMTLDKQ
jgi:hypothetical protein